MSCCNRFMGPLAKAQLHQQSLKQSSPMNIMSCMGASGYPVVTTTSALAIPPHSSPESNNVDSFIHDLLQSVTNDDLALCSSCEEGIAASSRCRDCSELLCDPCVRAHQRVRLTKDHRIVSFNGSNSISATTGSLGSSSQASNSPCSSGLGGNHNFCDLHHEPHRLYCETCMAAACTECTLLEHRGHQLVYIQDAVDAAKSNGVRLSAETRSAISAVREAMDNVQRINESLDVRSMQVIAEVRTLTKRFMAAMENREKELLTRIEHQRQMKAKALMTQMDNLRMALNSLGRTSEILNESLETGSGIDMIMANEKAAGELKHLRAIKSELIPCEDESMVFIAPDPSMIRAIGTMGNVVVNNNRLMRNRNGLGLGYANVTAAPVEFKINVSEGVRGRPIHGLAVPVVAKDSTGVVFKSFGSEGEDDGQLCRPWGVCCDRTGNIIVADRSNNRVQVFNASGGFVRKFGVQGTGPGQFDRPAGVAVDPLNRIIIADKDNHRIQVFTLEGAFIFMFGEKGCRNGQFNYPWDVAVNSLGHIVVSDTRNHRIQLFTNEGIFMNKYGFESTATMWKHFDSPRGVCFNPAGSVIVTDFNNHRLVEIDQNFTNAHFLGQEGSGFKQFLRPQGIICDDEGRIIVADSRNNRIQVFESNGTFLRKMGQAGKGPGELDRPSGIAVNPDGRIVVVDFGNNRVQIF